MGLLDGIFSLIGGGLDYFQEQGANKANLEQVRETNAQNLALTRESWAREDNAVQRRAADLKAAGLNPVLAAGSAASTSGAAQMSPGISHPALVGDKISKAYEAMRMKQDISQSQAQTDLINGQNDLVKAQKEAAANEASINRFMRNIHIIDPATGADRQGNDAIAWMRMQKEVAAKDKAIADSTISENDALASATRAKSAAWDFNKAVERNQKTNTGGIVGQLVEGGDYITKNVSEGLSHLAQKYGRFNNGRNK